MKRFGDQIFLAHFLQQVSNNHIVSISRHQKGHIVYLQLRNEFMNSLLHSEHVMSWTSPYNIIQHRFQRCELTVLEAVINLRNFSMPVWTEDTIPSCTLRKVFNREIKEINCAGYNRPTEFKICWVEIDFEISTIVSQLSYWQIRGLQSAQLYCRLNFRRQKVQIRSGK